jgi:hypothetical protein
MEKIPIQTQCPVCNGQRSLPSNDSFKLAGRIHQRYKPCSACEGSGTQLKWISLDELLALLAQHQCQHAHIERCGGQHFDAGDVWDDIHEYCLDCGVALD